MATLTLSVSTLTSSKSALDADATKILLNVFDAKYVFKEGDPVNPTNQQKLDWLVNWMARQLVIVAKDYEARKLRAAAAATEEAQVGAIKFGS